MFELEELLAGIEMDVRGDAPFSAPNWNYYGSSSGGAAAAAIADVIAGGQLLAQAVMAARRLQPTKTVKSLHAVFARSGRVSLPTTISVQTIQDGRTMGAVVLTFLQQDRPFATATVLTHAVDPDVIRHALPAPNVVNPSSGGLRISARGSHEIGFVPGTELKGPDDIGPPAQPHWIRFPDAPDDDAVAQALLAFVSNFQLVGIAMRPHAGLSQEQSHIAVSTGVLTHTISFHEPFAAKDWLVMDQSAPFAGNGRFYGRGDVFTADGLFIASFVQDGLIRGMGENHKKGAL